MKPAQIRTQNQSGSTYDQLFQETYQLVASSSQISNEQLLTHKVHGFLAKELKKQSEQNLLEKIKSKGGRALLLGMFLSGLAASPAAAVTPTFTEKTGSANPFANIVVTANYYGRASMAFGDIDNDGDLDLAIASEGYGNLEALNTGTSTTATFASTTTTLNANTSWNPANLALADLDNDGDLDFIGDGRKVHFNIGNASTPNWASTSTSFTSMNSTGPAAIADFDNDGDLDFMHKNFVLNINTVTPLQQALELPQATLQQPLI
ncbi:MAG: VCBS repeat-containing protein [SAR324 cluster bacterium]|nr:VCBS repeat-containing protein [SAR324 cluster bacterium]